MQIELQFTRAQEAGENNTTRSFIICVRIARSRRMRWVGHVERSGQMKVYIFYSEMPKGREHLKDLEVEESIILKCVLNTMWGYRLSSCA
jgi:hypothetical protein